MRGNWDWDIIPEGRVEWIGFSGGGFLSTAEDLVRFGSALLKPGLLKQETLEMIFSRQKTINGEQSAEATTCADVRPGRGDAMQVLIIETPLGSVSADVTSNWFVRPPPNT